MPPDDPTDPRPRLAVALDQITELIDTVAPSDLDRATPCDDYDVRTLLAHVLAVVRKLTVVGHDGDATEVGDPAEDPVQDWGAAIRSARTELERVWAADASLDGDRTLPWAVMPGREVLTAYTHEFTVHAWDLARATGRLDALDPESSQAALDWFTRYVPADDRPEGGGFGPAIPVAADADVHTRLAAHVGRKY